MSYPCPVCGYPSLPNPPIDMSYEICPSCGTEFGYTDFQRSHEKLMLAWLRTGPQWFAAWIPAPPLWNGRIQLLRYRIPSAQKASGNMRISDSGTRFVPTVNDFQLTVAKTANDQAA